MNEERLSGRASTPGSEGEACKGCCEQTHTEWARKILGGGNGSEAGAQGTGLLVELRLHVSSSLLHPLNPPHPLASDYIIKEKTVLLQKKDSEGFGFVLRGAKGECRPGRRWERAL